MLQKPKISEDCESGRHYDCELCSCECHQEDEELDEEDTDEDFKEETDL